MSTTIDPTTAATTETASDAKPRTPRLIEYPLEEGTKLSATPADFDINKHKRMPITAFVDQPTFLEHKADLMERKAAELRKDANDLRVRGPQIKAEKKFKAMQSQLAKLAAELAAAGVDVDALKAAE